MQDSDNKAPAIKLPSFKDIQESTAKRSRLQPTFSSGLVAGPAASNPIAAASTSNLAGSSRLPSTSSEPVPPVKRSVTPNAVTPGSSFPALRPGTSSAALDALQPPRCQSAPAQHKGQGDFRHNSTTSIPPAVSYSALVTHGNAILVNKNQQGNPLLQHLRNINYRFAPIIPDYQFNDKTAAIFLSLRFHRLKPLYVHHRIKALQRAFRTFLLCQCDVDDPVNPLAQVTKAAIDHHCTLLVAFSDLESARYLELLKAYESKSADSLKTRVEAEQSARVAAVLTSVRAVNKTDSATMGANFGTVAAMLKASEADLSSVPGLGPTKAKRLYNAFSAPLLRLHRMQASATESGDVSQCQGKAAAQVSNDHETEGEAAGQSASHRSLNADDMREWLATQEIIADVDESEDADLEDDFM